MLKPVDGPITSGFDEMRPLSKPVSERDHPHGAIDIAAPVGTPIKSPESGEAFCYVGLRQRSGQYWPELPTFNGMLFTWANYWYDTFGGIIVLQVPDSGMVSRTHVITHLWRNQMFNKGLYRFGGMVEEEEEKRFVLCGEYTAWRRVEKGETIGYVGNAGYSTGPHVHWEVHPGSRYFKPSERIDPSRRIA